MARHIRKKSAGRKAAITRLQREKKELKFLVEARGEQLHKAGLPVRYPRLKKKK
jgi:hypothetical protein